MPGEWMIGLGKGLSDASGSVDLWAKMRESRERTELERQQNEANAAYQRGQLEREAERNALAQRTQDWTVLKNEVENLPLDAPIDPERAAIWEKGGFGSFLRKEAPHLGTIGGTPLYAGTPGPIASNMPGAAPTTNTWTMRPSADPGTHVPQGIPGGTTPGIHEPTAVGDLISRIPPGLPGGRGAPMMATPGATGSDVDQYFNRGTETARTRAQEYAAELRARSAAGATSAAEQRNLYTLIAASMANNRGGLDSLRDYLVGKEMAEAARLRAQNAGDGSPNNYANTNWTADMNEAGQMVAEDPRSAGLTVEERKVTQVMIARKLYEERIARTGTPTPTNTGAGVSPTGMGITAVLPDGTRIAPTPAPGQTPGPGGLADPRREGARAYLGGLNKLSPERNRPEDEARIDDFLKTTPTFGR